MRKFLLGLLVLVSCAASAVPVWRWVDENGTIHYSDRPVPGAERIELDGAQSFPSGARLPPRPTPSGRQQEGDQSRRYSSLDVISPAEQETLWNIGATLEVQVALDPPLQRGHRLDVYLDGQLQNVDATSARFTVPEVYRGMHRLRAIVEDANGRELVGSGTVTFMVQQTSIQNPNNPNAPPRRRN
ncbi:MAG: DUF4124 domain-containing protein [Gammaproteobacteria bacterium]|nr:DUF4124 domain-containing protein [Gammaproteobacteria bacterium]